MYKSAVLQHKIKLYKCARYIYRIKTAHYRRKYREKQAAIPLIIAGAAAATALGSYLWGAGTGAYRGYQRGVAMANKKYDNKKTWGNWLGRNWEIAKNMAYYGHLSGAGRAAINGADVLSFAGGPWVGAGVTALTLPASLALDEYERKTDEEIKNLQNSYGKNYDGSDSPEVIAANNAKSDAGLAATQSIYSGSKPWDSGNRYSKPTYNNNNLGGGTSAGSYDPGIGSGNLGSTSSTGAGDSLGSTSGSTSTNSGSYF